MAHFSGRDNTTNLVKQDGGLSWWLWHTTSWYKMAEFAGDYGTQPRETKWRNLPATRVHNLVKQDNRIFPRLRHTTWWNKMSEFNGDYGTQPREARWRNLPAIAGDYGTQPRETRWWNFPVTTAHNIVKQDGGICRRPRHTTLWNKMAEFAGD